MKDKTINLRFNMLWAFYAKGADAEMIRLGSLHPSKALKELGMTYKRAIPQSIAEQWWLLGCENVPEPLPPFLSELGFDPIAH